MSLVELESNSERKFSVTTSPGTSVYLYLSSPPHCRELKLRFREVICARPMTHVFIHWAEFFTGPLYPALPISQTTVWDNDIAQLYGSHSSAVPFVFVFTKFLEITNCLAEIEM